MKRSVVHTTFLSFLVAQASTFTTQNYTPKNCARTLPPLKLPKMSATGNTDAPTALRKAKTLISNAIATGAPAYNAGNIEECARVYKSTALEILSSNLLPGQRQIHLESGLRTVIETVYDDANDEAWALRRQFDAIVDYRPPLTSPVGPTAPSVGSRSRSEGTALSINNAKVSIAKAISVGAPAYNAGNIEECARVYRAMALEITSLLPSSLATDLATTIGTSFHGDHAREAWAFRRQFDTIVAYEPPFTPSSNNDNYTLEKFTDEMVPSLPKVVNDNVMGGVSSGGWHVTSKTFVGSTSLQNNGGFASLRWRLPYFQNWSYAKGLYLKVAHSCPEKHTFRLVVKDTTCERVRGANFKIVFSNPSSCGDEIFVPFEAFDRMERMGQMMNGPSFNRFEVTEIGLMAIKPTVVGEFELRVEEWGLYY